MVADAVQSITAGTAPMAQDLMREPTFRIGELLFAGQISLEQLRAALTRERQTPRRPERCSGDAGGNARDNCD